MVAHVVGVVPGRLLHKFPHLDGGREVHHRIKAVGSEQARQHGPVGQIAHDQLSSQHGIPVAMAQVVEHHNVVSPWASRSTM